MLCLLNRWWRPPTCRLLPLSQFLFLLSRFRRLFFYFWRFSLLSLVFCRFLSHPCLRLFFGLYLLSDTDTWFYLRPFLNFSFILIFYFWGYTFLWIFVNRNYRITDVFTSLQPLYKCIYFLLFFLLHFNVSPESHLNNRSRYSSDWQETFGQLNYVVFAVD